MSSSVFAFSAYPSYSLSRSDITTDSTVTFFLLEDSCSSCSLSCSSSEPSSLAILSFLVEVGTVEFEAPMWDESANELPDADAGADSAPEDARALFVTKDVEVCGPFVVVVVKW